MAIVAFDSNSVRTTPDDWRAFVKSAIRDPNELLCRLEFPSDLASLWLANTDSAHRQFQTFVPEPFLERMAKGDPADPLLRQVLPRASEMDVVPGFSADAVGDSAAERTPGLIHKYDGRALLIARGACAVHCRYCFRRHYPYGAGPVSTRQFDKTLDIVRQDPSIEEVILSGGDPLMMVDDRLEELVGLIDAIPHVQRLRIHTRLPVVIPQRVTVALQQMLSETRLARFVVLHINHPNEIDEPVVLAVEKLRSTGATLMNQAVLLKDVNDDVDTLVRLSKRLVNMNCLPYYLHQLDRVQGAAHFEVEPETGRSLIKAMQKQLPGYAMPKYVQEIAGEPSKTIL